MVDGVTENINVEPPSAETRDEDTLLDVRTLKSVAIAFVAPLAPLTKIVQLIGEVILTVFPAEQESFEAAVGTAVKQLAPLYPAGQL
jgi:hypothetical protein